MFTTIIKYYKLLSLYFHCKKSYRWATTTTDQNKKEICASMYTAGRLFYKKQAPSWWPQLKGEIPGFGLTHNDSLNSIKEIIPKARAAAQLERDSTNKYNA